MNVCKLGNLSIIASYQDKFLAPLCIMSHGYVYT